MQPWKPEIKHNVEHIQYRVEVGFDRFQQFSDVILSQSGYIISVSHRKVLKYFHIILDTWDQTQCEKYIKLREVSIDSGCSQMLVQGGQDIYCLNVSQKILNQFALLYFLGPPLRCALGCGCQRSGYATLLEISVKGLIEGLKNMENLAKMSGKTIQNSNICMMT